MRIIYPIILLLLLSQSAYADRNDAVYAYLQGDYEKTYQIMSALANTADDEIAQYYLGVMYLQGQGVEQNYETAGKWFRAASQQGLAVAMYKLAKLYTSGNGVPKDLELAYVWYSVAATYKHKKSTAILAEAKEKLSNQETIAAEALIREYLKKYKPKEKKTENTNSNNKPTPATQ